MDVIQWDERYGESMIRYYQKLFLIIIMNAMSLGGILWGDLGYLARIYAQEPITTDTIENLLVDGMERGIKGDYRGAIIVFNKVINLDPNEVEAYYNRGIAYKMLKQWQKAIADFDQVLTIHSSYADAYVQRSGIYLNLSQKEKAITDLEMAIQLFEAQNNPAAVQWVKKKLTELD